MSQRDKYYVILVSPTQEWVDIQHVAKRLGSTDAYSFQSYMEWADARKCNDIVDLTKVKEMESCPNE